MNKILLKGSLFILGAFLIFYLFSLFARKNDLRNDYMQGIIAKHQLISKTKKRAIIVAGGSNIAFGIDSKAIQDEFNVPVINLGLNASLGLDFLTKELEDVFKPGDLVLISVEYFWPLEGQYDLQKSTSNFYGRAKRYYTTNYISELEFIFKNHQKVFKSVFQKANFIQDANSFNKVYNRNAFNQYGDVVSHLSLKPSNILKDRGFFSQGNWGGIVILNELYRVAKSKKVNIFYLFPTYPESEYNKNEKVISALDIDLHKGLDMPILNKRTDFVYEDSLFFDTIYHLTKEGRSKRTADLIKLLKSSAVYSYIQQMPN